MSWAGTRVGVGTPVMYDGETYEVTEWLPTPAGTDVLTGPKSVVRMSLVALVGGSRSRWCSVGPFAGPGIAVREVVMKPGHGRIDYLLYVDKAVGGLPRIRINGNS
jgi:hypothetical protein